MIAYICEYIKKKNTLKTFLKRKKKQLNYTLLKWVKCMVYKLYLKKVLKTNKPTNNFLSYEKLFL